MPLGLVAPDLVLQTVTSAGLPPPPLTVPTGISARVHSPVEVLGPGRAADACSGPCLPHGLFYHGIR